jgi:hypothetical protein
MHLLRDLKWRRHGRAVTRVVSHRLLAAKSRVRSQTCPRGNCVGQTRWPFPITVIPPQLQFHSLMHIRNKIVYRSVSINLIVGLVYICCHISAEPHLDCYLCNGDSERVLYAWRSPCVWLLSSVYLWKLSGNLYRRVLAGSSNILPYVL